MISLGIDIGGTAVKVAALLDGAVDWTARSGEFRHPSPARLTEAIRSALPPNLPQPVAAVGVCVPGLLDEHDGALALSVNLPDLIGVPLRPLLRDATGADPRLVRFLTDAHATAYDLWSTRRPARRLLVLAIGTGVGAAVLDEPDGRPLHVDGESPGHLGQCDVSIDENPPIGPDGGAGGLEAYVGADALRSRYGPDLTAALARLTVEDPPLRALARAVRIAHALYRPHHVCLAGGIGLRLAPALPALRSLIEKDLTRIARPGWTLTTGDTDFHAARGAARLAPADV